MREGDTLVAIAPGVLMNVVDADGYEVTVCGRNVVVLTVNSNLFNRQDNYIQYCIVIWVIIFIIAVFEYLYVRMIN